MRVEKSILIKSLAVFLIIEVIAIITAAYEWITVSKFDGNIKRSEKENVTRYEPYTVESEWGKEDISIQISPIKRDENEIKSLIENAKKEIDATILGQNESLDNITDRLIILDSYQKGLVKATWNFDNYEILNSGGNLIYENIAKDTMVRAYCTLSVENHEETYVFDFLVKKPSVDTSRGFDYLLQEELLKRDQDEKNIESISLPSKLGGINLSWYPKRTYSGRNLAIFGVFAGGLIIIASKNQEKNEEKALKKQLEIDYPDIVSMISLYIGAGVSLKGTVDKISNDYKTKLVREGNVRPGFEGILKLQRQINDGRGELESLKEFGKRMNHKDYRKLSIILTQNLKKGTAMLAEQLEKEEQQAFEDRKLRAKIAGEEASTKLLLPMMGLLSIVLIVLIFPAIVGISI